MGPPKAAVTVIGVGNGVGAALAMAAGVGIGVGGTVVPAPHADIPARSRTNVKAYIDRGHQYMREF